MNKDFIHWDQICINAIENFAKFKNGQIRELQNRNLSLQQAYKPLYISLYLVGALLVFMTVCIISMAA